MSSTVEQSVIQACEYSAAHFSSDVKSKKVFKGKPFRIMLSGFFYERQIQQADYLLLSALIQIKFPGISTVYRDK
ncbi:hypothetical protein RN49_04180 [Pantoea agglomerans]|nr:hypothetical protein RN49_04180 [Pantoea agglomerans]